MSTNVLEILDSASTASTVLGVIFAIGMFAGAGLCKLKQAKTESETASHGDIGHFDKRDSRGRAPQYEHDHR